jgi:hypothetical protein
LLNLLKLFSLMKDFVSYTLPDFSVPEHKKDENWYKNAVRYYASFYNRNQNNNTMLDNPNEMLNPVDRGLNYMLYYEGKQKNVNYNHVTTDINGNTLQAVWIPGKKVKSLIDHRLGYISSQFKHKEISVTSLAPEVVSWKQRKLENGLLKFDTEMIELLAMLEQEGVQYDPMDGMNFDTKDEWEKYINTSLKDYGEIVMTNIANEIETQNDSNTEYKKAFLDWHAFGYAAMYNYVENGNVNQKCIRAWQVIYDNLDDSPTKKNMKFGGFIERLTPEEIFSKWGDQLDDNAKQEIIQISKSKNSSGNYQPIYNNIANTYNTPNISYWDFDQGQLVVSCTTIFFIAPRDTRYEKSTDKYGKEHITRIKRKNRKGQFITYDLYKGVLIGNKWLVDYGLASNVVRNKFNKTMPQIPLMVFTHNTVLGSNLPPIGQIAQHQDNMDFYRFKIMEIVSRDAGKNYVIHGDKLEGTTSKSLITDFKSIGIHVTAGSSGEYDDPSNVKRFVEYIDLTLDPNVMRYVELYREEEMIMEKIMSTNQVELGQQQQYMSQGTQKATIAQTQQGVLDLYQNFTKFNEACLQQSIEIAKMVYALDGDQEKVFILGDRGVKFLKLTKDMLFQDMLLFVNTNDVIDEAARERIKAYVQAWSQNPNYGITPLDIIKIEQATTYQEMVSQLDMVFRRNERKQAEAMQQQMMQQMMMQQANAESQENQTVMREMGATERAAMNNDAAMEKTQMQNEANLTSQMLRG